MKAPSEYPSCAVIKALKSRELGITFSTLGVCAMNFSETAVEKLEEVKGERVILLEEIKKNPKAVGIKFLELVPLDSSSSQQFDMFE